MQTIKKIKVYAIISFFLPLIAINSCFLLYKILGEVSVFTNLNWESKNIKYEYNQDYLVKTTSKFPPGGSLTNCPKYIPIITLETHDNQIILDSFENQDLIKTLIKNDKIKTINIKEGKTIHSKCVKNKPLLFYFLKKFPALEKILISSIKNNPAGFSLIKNPYIYGEVSISRTARFFPAILIFKTLIILSSFTLFLYWKNNFNLFNELKNKKILFSFSKSFFYLGVFSCIFLTLHAIFLGLDYDSKLFSKFRKFIIISFIFSEVFAQIFLTKNLLKIKNKINEQIKPTVLNIKIIFVTLVLIITFISFFILVYFDPTSSFNHILEWNYFAFLLFFYLLSRLLWR